MNKLLKYTTMMVTAAMLSSQQAVGNEPVATITWDATSLMIDGRRVMPVMGEMHYSRVPEDEWAAELQKMRDGGVNILATYIFWNHIEEVEGQYDWSGQRNLRRFLQLCREAQMPVVLRIGP